MPCKFQKTSRLVLTLVLVLAFSMIGTNVDIGIGGLGGPVPMAAYVFVFSFFFHSPCAQVSALQLTVCCQQFEHGDKASAGLDTICRVLELPRSVDSVAGATCFKRQRTNCNMYNNWPQ